VAVSKANAVVVEGDLELFAGEGGIFGIAMTEEIFEVETGGGVSAVGNVPDDAAEEVSSRNVVSKTEAGGVVLKKLDGDEVGFVVINKVGVVLGDDGPVRMLVERNGVPRKTEWGNVVRLCVGVAKLGIGYF